MIWHTCHFQNTWISVAYILRYWLSSALCWKKAEKNGQRSLKVIDDLDVCETSNRSGPSYVCLHCTIYVDLNRVQMVQITYIFLVQLFCTCSSSLMNIFFFQSNTLLYSRQVMIHSFIIKKAEWRVRIISCEWKCFFQMAICSQCSHSTFSKVMEIFIRNKNYRFNGLSNNKRIIV